MDATNRKGGTLMTARKKRPKKKLEVDKRPLEDEPEDLPVDKEEADDIMGGLAPPWVWVRPLPPSEPAPRQDLPGRLPRPDRFEGG